MPIPEFKAAVSNDGILREIESAQKKLSSLEKDADPLKREAIVRQMLQLEVCKNMVLDFFIIP